MVSLRAAVIFSGFVSSLLVLVYLHMISKLIIICVEHEFLYQDRYRI